ncbi:aminoglycoside phosphotransferase family protein [Paenibacillus nasutitermitis]|uniref:Aminoglycoside phosphotransferase domain-containing protein n=1 Tax=Paenibacillus nasutitermitis TaxID=1652958 RepID=A0A917DWJ0_9BACL|nr:aminoglycoside phosphotransferase family protein [Paenibacillus nasutitermitis]GGD78178.1 hypothetical protein GCM10010911_40240 [Paenibacillus nasutitermitis]
MDELKTILEKHYGLENMVITAQMGGWAALAYKAAGNNRSYFLKMYEKSRASTPKWTALIDKYIPVLQWLGQHTVLAGKIPVPLVTRNGNYKCEDDDGIYLLYEYIEGETIGGSDLTENQISQLAVIVSELHKYGSEIPVETDGLKESFEVPFAPLLQNMLDEGYDRLADDLKKQIDPYKEILHRLIVRMDHLSAGLKNSHVPMALCHTDIHNWNLMQTGRQLNLIDWEGLKLAPVEADLMFLTDSPYYNEFMDSYRKSHPGFSLNPNALLFYQIRRKLEDIWEWLEQLLFDIQSPVERAGTLSSLMKELEGMDG